MDLMKRFLEETGKHSFWTSNDRIILAVSGGVDSIVLLDLMTRLPRRSRPELIIAHFNHHLRKESMEEEAAVKELAESKNLPIYTADWPVEEHPDSGTETAARNARYRFFKKVMHETKADFLATAHHRSDQLETLLMRFVRGGQLERMTGIQRIRPFAKGHLIRPLLSFSKEKLYQHADACQLPYFEDASNQDLQYTRNRYRQQIIPLLKKENPLVEEHAEQFAEDLKDLMKLADPLIQSGVEQAGFHPQKELSFSRESFLRLAEPLQKFVLFDILQKVYEERAATFNGNHVRQMREWITEGTPNSCLELPGELRAVRTYHSIQFVPKKEWISSTEEQTSWKLFPGEWVTLKEGKRVGLFKRNPKEQQPLFENQQAIFLDAQQIKVPLTIRHRQPGDRMTLKGMKSGTKKVKDIFIDQKVPAKEREEAFVVADASDEILWLVNFKESSLSIPPETDTIQYILIFQYI